MQKTLIIVKPDAVTQGCIGRILGRFEDEGLKILAMRMVHLTKEEAEGFYHVHRDKPFFGSLTDFMSSAPAVAVVLEGPDSINRVREIMGATDPKKAAKGTLRRLYATDVEKNAVHGSDSPESAASEIPYYFRALDIKRYERQSPEREGEKWDPLPPLR
jgi:nucleoside-diphosphate kinase